MCSGLALRLPIHSPLLLSLPPRHTPGPSCPPASPPPRSFIDTNFAVFGEFFGQGHWAAAALGVGGSTVEELTYRIVAGGERFSQDPLVGPRAKGWAVEGHRVAGRRVEPLACTAAPTV